MKTTILKTITVAVENADILIALMDHIGFEETERVATGGMMSTPILMMTFWGQREDYREDFYVEVEDKWGSMYHSLKYPDGTKSEAELKEERPIYNFKELS